MGDGRAGPITDPAKQIIHCEQVMNFNIQQNYDMFPEGSVYGTIWDLKGIPDDLTDWKVKAGMDKYSYNNYDQNEDILLCNDIYNNVDDIIEINEPL
jgi:hypothetical protein